MEDSAIAMVALRNDFYRRKYQTVLLIHLLSWLVIFILLGMIYYLHKHPRSPYFFATDNALRFFPSVPLQQPNMTDDAVIAWAGEAIESAMSYNYMNYREELQNAQKYFTDYGWHTYMQGLTQSLNLVALKERKQIVTAKLAGPGKITVEGGLGSTQAYAWKIEFPVLVTYMMPPYDNSPDRGVFQNALNVSVIVQRQDELASYKGLGIVQLIATLQT